ncbi:hypothetical protein A6P54_02560 [Bacillus sp. MKU004]|nr:hypothetical protein A6P54_02560 [Bacillus sp. MKU004]
MNTSKVEIVKMSAHGKDLLERAKKVLVNSQSDKIINLSHRIPDTMIPDGEINVVLAGQYSAGKSSILKTMTNRNDISIGGGITTQKAHPYDWEGIKIIDTPGIHTKLRPDHDEVSYRAISDSDLLLFVITNELFDSHLVEHFRKLAIEKDKAHEMMLVINKMGRSDQGNTTQMQEIIKEDIRNVLTPFSPEDFHICFIDAKYALESMEEEDKEFAEILWRKSGLDSFIDILNNFVKEKGLSSQYTTSLYALEQVLLEALAAESTGDDDIDALEELLLQQRRALLETQARIPQSVENEVQVVGAKIRQEGRKIADLIHGSADQKEVNQKLQDAQDRVQEYVEQLNQSIESVIGEHIEDLQENVTAITRSELAKELLPRLIHRIEEANITPEAMAHMKTSGDMSQRLGKFLVEKSFTLKGGYKGLFNLNHYSGTSTHGAVKAVGKFFGHKFKPWEAVKWSRGIANAGRVFAVAGTVLTFVLQVKEDADAAQLEVDLRESRVTVRNGFNEAAHLIELHYDKATGTYVASTLTTEIESVDNQLSELRSMQQSRSEIFTKLVNLLEETRSLIRKVHQETID